MDGTTGWDLSQNVNRGVFFDTRNQRTPGRDEQAVRGWNTNNMWVEPLILIYNAILIFNPGCYTSGWNTNQEWH